MQELYTLSPDELEKRLLDQVSNTWPPVDKALAMAKSAHEGQVRKGSGEPYVTHPIRTALLLIECADQQKNAAVICAGLLHDVEEDTSVTANDVEDEISPQVGDLVRALTHPKQKAGESSYERNKRYLESLRWEGRDAQIVKSADRLDNILTMEGAFTPERRAEYILETEEGVLPLTLACNTALYHALKNALAVAKASS